MEINREKEKMKGKQEKTDKYQEIDKIEKGRCVRTYLL